MSVLNRIDISNFKGKKPFEKHDIFIYALLTVLIMVLFVVFVISPACNKDNGQGFNVHIDGKLAVTCYYDGKIDIEKDFVSSVEKQSTENGYIIKIYTGEDNSQFNTLQVDFIEQSVKIIDSNCPTKNCNHLPAIKKNGSIICMPHGVTVKPIGKQFTPPTTGG